MMTEKTTVADLVKTLAFTCLIVSLCVRAALGTDLPNRGAIAFTTADAGWRSKVGGFLSAAPKFRPTYSGALQHWLVTWDGESVSYYATDGIGLLVPKSSHSENALRVLTARKGRGGKVSQEDLCEKDLGAVLKNIRFFGEAKTREQVLSYFDSLKWADLGMSSHFGTEGAEKALSAVVTACNGRDLTGFVLELVDANDKPVAPSVALDRTGGKADWNPLLPFGEYRCRVRRGKTILAEERYGVLSRSLGPSITAGTRVGEPRKMTLVKRIAPDPDRMPDRTFRSVGQWRIGSLNGVSYLETGERAWDRFAIRVNVDTNAPLHCFEIDYPDDRKRTMDILVQDTWYRRNPANRKKADYTLAVGVATGGIEYRNQNRILTHRCLFWTGSGEDVTLVISAVKARAPAAFSEIRLYRVDDEGLPVAPMNEPPANEMGLRRYVGQFWEDPAVTHDFRFAQRTLQDIDSLIGRHMAQMRYTGQNMLAYPGAWYNGLLGRDGYTERGHRKHFLEAYYEKFDRAGLLLMPTVELLQVPQSLDGLDESSLTNGALYRTAFNARATGEFVSGWHGAPPNFSVAHPAVQSRLTDIVRELVKEGRDHPSFKGVTLFLPMDTCAWWGSIDAGYNDYCIEAFERVAGLHVPVDRRDPKRGRLYAEWLRANAYEKWVSWRCSVVTDLYVRLARILSEARPDLCLRLDVAPPVDVMRNLAEHPDFYTDAIRPRLMREAGIDAEAIRSRIPNLIFGPIVWNLRQRKRDSWMTDPKVLERSVRLPETASWWREAAQMPFPQAVIRDDFWESDVGTKSKGDRALNCDWFREIEWRVSAILPSDYNAMKYFALPLRYGDFMGVSRGGFLIGDYGMERLEARFAQAFRALPAVRMSEFMRDGNVVGRACRFRGHQYFYVVNTGDLTVTVKTRFPEDTRDLVTGVPFSGKRELKLARARESGPKRLENAELEVN